MKKIALMLAIAVAAVACKPEEQITPEVTVNSDAAALIIEQEGGEVLIDFDANVEWTAAFKGAADWCTLSPASGAAGPNKVKVIAVENETNDNRTVTVVITAQTAVKEVVVTQLQKDALVISGEKTFAVPAEGGEVKFAVNHNLAIDVTTDADWLTQTKAMETSEITLAVAANTGAERTAEIVVKAGALKQTLTVTQAAWVPKFDVEPAADQWIAVGGGSVSVTVDANVEYTVTVGENDWLTVTNDGGVYTFTAGANASFDYRAIDVTVAPVDEAYAESAVAFYVFQNGRANKLWAKHPAEDFEGYDPAQKVRLAQYGEYVLLANTTKVFVLNPLDGSVVTTIAMPEGMTAQSVLVDDAGHLLIAADAGQNADLNIIHVPDPFDPVPEVVCSYNTGNYYGSLETGNIRVKGNIKENAVITATVAGSCLADGSLDPASGAVIYWEVVNGVLSDWNWTNVPYTAWGTSTICAHPAGASIADGLFYIGYGGDYNLYYTANVTKGGASEWAVSYVTGSSWMENYNCIATAEWNGSKYAAIVASCHFSYDASDVILLNVNNPAAAEYVYAHHGDGDVAWDWAAGVNPSWTGAGTYSDVVLIPAGDTLLMVYVDTNYGAMACVAIN